MKKTKQTPVCKWTTFELPKSVRVPVMPPLLPGMFAAAFGSVLYMMWSTNRKFEKEYREQELVYTIDKRIRKDRHEWRASRESIVRQLARDEVRKEMQQLNTKDK